MAEQTDLLPPAKTAAPLDAAHARAMLRKRFAAPEWALMEELHRQPEAARATRTR